jgi:hypothetical protein
MLQLTATNRYDFKPAQNGYLMSLNSASRALFLTLVFPRIVARGRRWYSAKRSSTSAGPSSTSSPSPTPTLIDPDELPITAEAFEPVSGLQEVEEPVNVPVSMAPTDAANGSAFDLVFLKSASSCNRHSKRSSSLTRTVLAIQVEHGPRRSPDGACRPQHALERDPARRSNLAARLRDGAGLQGCALSLQLAVAVGR